jgi:hypothetical protein
MDNNTTAVVIIVSFLVFTAFMLWIAVKDD